jgi:hypothetical protein
MAATRARARRSVNEMWRPRTTTSNAASESQIPRQAFRFHIEIFRLSAGASRAQVQ